MGIAITSVYYEGQNISSNVKLTTDVEINPLNTILYVKNGDITAHAQCQLWWKLAVIMLILISKDPKGYHANVQLIN